MTPNSVLRHEDGVILSPQATCPLPVQNPDCLEQQGDWAEMLQLAVP